jgi:hypothetical protein
MGKVEVMIKRSSFPIQPYPDISYAWSYMFDREKIISGSNTIISLILCTALNLNTGCQSIQQKPLSLQKDTASQNKIQEIEPKGTAQNQSKISQNIDEALEGMGEFITETANSVSYIPIAGAVVAAVCLDYESWRTLVEAF